METEMVIIIANMTEVQAHEAGVKQAGKKIGCLIKL